MKHQNLKQGWWLLAAGVGAIGPAMTLIPGCSGGTSGGLSSTTSSLSTQSAVPASAPTTASAAEREAAAAAPRFFFSTTGTVNANGLYTQESGTWFKLLCVPITPTPTPTKGPTPTPEPTPTVGPTPPPRRYFFGTYNFSEGPHVGQKGQFILVLKQNTRSVGYGSPNIPPDCQLEPTSMRGSAIVRLQLNKSAGTGTGRVKLSNGDKGPITITSKFVFSQSELQAQLGMLPPDIARSMTE